MTGEIDWEAWSREAVTLMHQRNREWPERYDVPSGGRWHWDMETAELTFEREASPLVAEICVIGTTSVAEGTFLWAWANESTPAGAQRRLDEVRAFGELHDLYLLCEAEQPGGRPEALELLALAGRILDAPGVFISPGEDVSVYMVILGFKNG